MADESIIQYVENEEYTDLILTFFDKIIENSKKHQITDEIIFDDVTYSTGELNLGDILILNIGIDLYKDIDSDGLVNKWWSDDEEDEYLKLFEKVANYEDVIRDNIENLIEEPDISIVHFNKIAHPKGMYIVNLPALYERMGLVEQHNVFDDFMDDLFDEFDGMAAFLLKERLEEEHSDSEFDWAAIQDEATVWDTDLWEMEHSELRYIGD